MRTWSHLEVHRWFPINHYSPTKNKGVIIDYVITRKISVFHPPVFCFYKLLFPWRFFFPLPLVFPLYLLFQNRSDRRIFFKMKTTCPHRYVVRPHQSSTAGHTEAVMEVILLPFHFKSGQKYKDRFLLQVSLVKISIHLNVCSKYMCKRLISAGRSARWPRSTTSGGRRCQCLRLRSSGP